MRQPVSATRAQETVAPSTAVPSTAVPSTGVPSTGVPSTGVPSTGVPSPAVPTTGARAAVRQLPRAPGVYRFRDAGGHALYLGRATDLRRRVASYWGDLGDRPHLAPMVARIARIEAVECASEHEAAFLERSLLEERLLPWNRTAGGQESEVVVRLDRSPSRPGLSVTYPSATRSAGPRDVAAEYFGPYLGGARVRLAVAGLLRVVPLHHTAENPAGLARALAVRHGVAAGDRDALAGAAAAVLRREPAAVEALRRDLAARRDEAARCEAFELAARIHAEIEATDWVTAPQRVAGCAAADAAVSGWARGLLTTFEIRSGRIRSWRISRASERRASLALAATPQDWRDFADRNAALAAALALVPA